MPRCAAARTDSSAAKCGVIDSKSVTARKRDIQVFIAKLRVSNLYSRAGQTSLHMYDDDHYIHITFSHPTCTFPHPHALCLCLPYIKIAA